MCSVRVRGCNIASLWSMSITYVGRDENRKIKDLTKSFLFISASMFLSQLVSRQRDNTEISKHIFPGKELRGLSPNFHIHVSVSNLYIIYGVGKYVDRSFGNK
jgi:hypothetical protein